MTTLLVNFGGPRSLDEITPFLTTLLQDRDVVRTRLPKPLHNWLFGRIARKRSLTLAADYNLIGGKSPIYFDTEALATHLNALTFHRYLPATHADSLRKIESSNASTIRVLPLFPQFSYATTGSIARFLSTHLSSHTLLKLRWIPSYAAHPAYIAAFQLHIRHFLHTHHLPESETTLLFSAHGLPQSFTNTGDPYQSDCEASYNLIRAAFPLAATQLSYQSKFGRGEWLRPYTNELCENPPWPRPNIVIVPLSFTSDHIETLYEIEYLYLPPLRAHHLNAFRCPALNLEPHWLSALSTIAESHTLVTTPMLVRNPAVSFSYCSP